MISRGSVGVFFTHYFFGLFSNKLFCAGFMVLFLQKNLNMGHERFFCLPARFLKKTKLEKKLCKKRSVWSLTTMLHCNQPKTVSRGGPTLECGDKPDGARQLRRRAPHCRSPDLEISYHHSGPSSNSDLKDFGGASICEQQSRRSKCKDLL